MAYSLERFAADCRAALDRDPGRPGREEMRRLTERACSDPGFVGAHLGPDNTAQRKILYEDDRHGFCILAHVYEGARDSTPHDHGPSWAIYGQAEGVTTMRDWEKVAEPSGGEPGKVREGRVYDLRPGMAHLYNEGDLHAPSRAASTRLVRIEGRNLSGVPRDKYVAVE